jgi:integrase
MASLEKRGGSQYWQLRFRDPATGKRLREPTPYRWNDRMETRAARELCARKTYEDKQAPRTAHKDKWTAWVRNYIQVRYADSPKTRDRYLTSWKTVETFLVEQGADCAARVNHSGIMKFIEHRRGSRKKPIASSTIGGEIKVLRIVIDEAIRRGWATTNPTLRLRLSRKPTREMRALSLDEERLVRDALTNGIPEREVQVTQTNQTGNVFTYTAKRPGWQPQGASRTGDNWMLRSFEIAMAQGCRFSETRIPLHEINLERMTILIRGKGGKVFQTALNPRLVPMIRELKARGEKWTWDLPAAEMRQCARQWTRFFKRLGVPDFWFHCTRATAITRAHELGVSYPLAMAYFGHASGLVHSIYTRLGVESAAPVAAALASYGEPRYSPTSENADARRATAKRGRASSGGRIGTGSPKPSSR